MHLLAYAGLFSLSVLLVVIAAWLRGRERSLVKRGVRAQGWVAGCVSSADVGGGAARYDVVEFVDMYGRRRQVESRVGVPWSPHRGRNVTVLYDPNNHDDAVIEGAVEQWAPAAIFGATGLLMAVFAVVMAALEALGIISPG